MKRDAQLALLWHLVEFLAAFSILGLVWSICHQPRFLETKRPAR